MISRALRACAVLAAVAAVPAFGQGQPEAPKPEAAKPAEAPKAKGGTIFAEFNQTLPDEAFDNIAKQAGVELMVQEDSVWSNAEAITMKVENGYFWPTFLEMCKQSNLRFNFEWVGNGQSRLRLYDSRNGSGQFDNCPRVVSQGVVLMATNASRNFNISYSNANATPNNQFYIQMTVFSDPLCPVSQWGTPVVTEAVDENGTSLVLKGNNGNMFGSNENSLQQNVGIPLANPEKIGKKLVSLKGSLRGSAVTKSEKVDIDLPLPAEGKTIKTSDFDVTFISLKPDKPDGKNYHLKLKFVSANAPDADGVRKGGLRRNRDMNFWNMVNRIVIKDAEGKTLSVGGGSSSGENSGVSNYDISVNANGDVGAPAKILWKLPAETKQIVVPFEFKDLQIP